MWCIPLPDPTCPTKAWLWCIKREVTEVGRRWRNNDKGRIYQDEARIRSVRTQQINTSTSVNHFYKLTIFLTFTMLVHLFLNDNISTVKNPFLNSSCIFDKLLISTCIFDKLLISTLYVEYNVLFFYVLENI